MTKREAEGVDPESWNQPKQSKLAAVRLWITRTMTPLGWFVVAFTLLSTVLTFTMGLVEYGVVAGFGLVMLAIAVPYLIGKNHSVITLALANDRVTVGAGAVLEITLTNESSRPTLPSRVEVNIGQEVVETRIPMILGRETLTISTQIDTPIRGVFQVGPATAVRQDPLGMFRRARTDNTLRTLYVHPRIVTVPSSSAGLIRDLDGNPTATIVDSDIAFHAIRPYMRGDAQRHIHWKSTAKTGALMVKQFEETRRSRLALLLGTAETEFANDDEFELAISVAGSLGVQAIADGRETEVLVSPTRADTQRANDRRVKSLSTATPRSLLDTLTTLMAAQGTTTLDHVGSRAAQSRQNASLVVLVVGSPVSYRELRSAAVPFGPDARVVAIICDPSSEPGARTIGDLTILRVGVVNDLQQLLLRGALS